MTVRNKSASMIAMLALSLVLFAASSCAGSPKLRENSDKLRVVATTTIVGDVVLQVGGDAIDLVVLLPPNADPHNYEPSPQDVAKVSQADVVFVNGLGLEGFLQSLVVNAGKDSAVFAVSDGIEPLHFAESAGDHPGDAGNAGDPHVWMDPNNVQLWVDNIAEVLTRQVPGPCNRLHGRRSGLPN